MAAPLQGWWFARLVFAGLVGILRRLVLLVETNCMSVSSPLVDCITIIFSIPRFVLSSLGASALTHT